jgi:hypothetical protein
MDFRPISRRISNKAGFRGFVLGRSFTLSNYSVQYFLQNMLSQIYKVLCGSEHDARLIAMSAEALSRGNGTPVGGPPEF